MSVKALLGRRRLSAALLVCAVCAVCAFYLLGSAPVNFCEAEKTTETCKSNVKLYVNRLDSEESVIPYDYSHFDFCQAEDVWDSPVKNLIQMVFGYRIRSSPYNISFLKTEECVPLCRKKYKMSQKEDVERLNGLMKGMLKNYQHHWVVDNLPVTWCYLVEGGRQYCSLGFPMGCYVDSQGTAKGACAMNVRYNKPATFYLFNHVDFTITYHSGENEVWGADFGEKGGRIMAVKVFPRSIKYDDIKQTIRFSDCTSYAPPMEIPGNLTKNDEINVLYSYSVYFSRDNSIKWSSRWD